MTLQQLNYVLAVDREGSFRKAADSCFVTQPTLSMQVQKLEEWLGVTLFDRGVHPVAPTPIGRRIIEQARIVVREAQKIQEMIAEEEGRIEGEFRLGVIPTLAPYLLPLFVKTFLDHYPGVQLYVQELQTEEMIDRIKSDEIDAGLIVTPLHLKEIQEWPLFYEPFYLYASENHPILKKVKVADSQLSQSEIFLLGEGHCFRDQVLSLCQRQGRDRHKALNFDSGSLSTVKKLVDQGSGYTLLPHLAAVDLVASSDQDRLRKFKDPMPFREVSLVFHQHFAQRRFLDALKETILDSLPEALKEMHPSSKRAIVPARAEA